MDKLNMHTPDKADKNIEKIAALFPNTVTEVIKGYREDGSAIIEHAIDFDMLRQELSQVVVEGPQERYQFTWPDKRKSILLANQPIAKTMRPCREESVDFDTTENLYIEGDNLDALKLMQETYLGKVKMIYIDPPYNTGNDFVYDDDFAQDSDEYMAGSGQFDEDGGRLVANLESNGRFHTDWLNMIYPRLKLAKDLLTDDGVIFISIDDNESANLRKCCDEVLGASNFVAQIIWQKVFAPKNSARQFSESHEYILCYAKNGEIWTPNLLPRNAEADNRYKNLDDDPRGPWASDNLTARNYYGAGTYPVTCPSGRIIEGPPTGSYWRISKGKFVELDSDNRIWWGADKNNMPRLKRFLSEVQNGMVPQTLWSYEEVGHTQEAKKELLGCVEFHNSDEVFDTPKPTRLISQMLKIATRPESNDIILDFFAGSATTAHSIMKVNADDHGNRKWIMVQIPEALEGNMGRTLADIGKERIRRAGRKIKDEAGLMAQNLDIGFRVFKIDSTNMQDVYYNPAEIKQEQLGLFADNIKSDRTGEDLLFQVMLDLGILLSSKIEGKVIGGKKVFSVADGYLIACFDNSVTTEAVTEIAKMKPYYAVFRDSGMASDSVATNFEQIFASYSPTTVRKVL